MAFPGQVWQAQDNAQARDMRDMQRQFQGGGQQMQGSQFANFMAAAYPAYQYGLQQSGNAPVGGAYGSPYGGWGMTPQIGQNYLGTARSAASNEYASDAAARGLLASTPNQLALSLSGSIPGAASAQNIAQINNQGKLTGLREILAAIAPMLAAGPGGMGRGGGGGLFPINTNYGAGIQWG